MGKFPKLSEILKAKDGVGQRRVMSAPRRKGERKCVFVDHTCHVLVGVCDCEADVVVVHGELDGVNFHGVGVPGNHSQRPVILLELHQNPQY